MKAIGQALSKRTSSIFGFLALDGGIAPVPRRRNLRVLSLKEREEISRGLCTGLSIRAIAANLGRARSTVSREVCRNGGKEKYRAVVADEHTWTRARRPKPCKLLLNPRLQHLVDGHLRRNWSPEQIAAWLKQTYPDDRAMHVSHETIYRSLFVQARGLLKKELQAHLRTRRTMRRSKKSTTTGQTRGQIVDAVSIRQRPADVEDRAVPGHWEGDLITGSRNTHIATLVERQSRFTVLVKVDSKDTKTVVDALIRKVQELPVELRRTLTWDRGLELAQHKRFSIATDVKVFFCDPQSPWQRGSNENTNGLLRQYFPKGTPLSGFSQEELDHVACELNTRPRKTLSWRTPAATLAAVLH